MRKYTELCITLIFILSCKNIQLIDSGNEEFYQKEITRLENQYQDPSWTARKKAISECSEFPSERTMNLLILASSDSHTSIQAEALSQLSFYKNKKAFDILYNYSINPDISDIVRIAALNGLSKYNSKLAADAFVSNINNPNNLVRKSAYSGLLGIHDRSIENISVEYILQGLSDESVTVQMTVLDEIRIKNPLIYKVFKDFLMTQENHNKNTMMLKVLKDLEGYEIDAELEETLKKLLVHYNTNIRLSAFRVLKNSKTKMK